MEILNMNNYNYNQIRELVYKPELFSSKLVYDMEISVSNLSPLELQRLYNHLTNVLEVQTVSQNFVQLVQYVRRELEFVR